MEKVQSNKSYFETTFKNISLPAFTCTDSEFESCEFIDCDFSQSTFKHCKFLDCTFRQCNLSLLQTPQTRFFETEFTNCKLVGVDWTQAYWPPYYPDPDLKFYECILNDSSMFGLTLTGLVLESCKLHDVDFREGNFSGATMTDCDFTNSLFMRTNLQSVDFTDSVNYTIHVLENQVQQARFSRFEALSLLETLGIELAD
ncbi:pentapeptide repeat-containing protein [Vibrio mangrovi]|uniref:Pentapeptide repeat-containing protein n=1 Tax=Vibrio mangrovi TaxID=474394 RepID=A0A1Y6IZK7_9VIBR|nr:pentapeptide repeat-containing protein [Vibrio mangrovi]MDW6002545.1 pentapeptide repeat-containing protein [Vibrio mangrovi]SMS01922.1 Pentapeptide repeats (8 copies) [Vibrio mangrovi]